MEKSASSCLFLAAVIAAFSCSAATLAAAAFSAGCALQDAYACGLLGVSFDEGAGTSKDPAQARQWYARSWTYGEARLAEAPEDRDLLCDHAELAINLRRPDAETRKLVELCVRGSKAPYQRLVAHVLSLTAARLAGRDARPTLDRALATLPKTATQGLRWSFKTLRVGLLGRPRGAELLGLLRALDESAPPERGARVGPLLETLKRAPR